MVLLWFVLGFWVWPLGVWVLGDVGLSGIHFADHKGAVELEIPTIPWLIYQQYRGVRQQRELSNHRGQWVEVLLLLGLQLRADRNMEKY